MLREHFDQKTNLPVLHLEIDRIDAFWNYAYRLSVEELLSFRSAGGEC